MAGGADALTVFAISDRQFEWFTIAKKSWITGFAVSASSLYVQDGAVLLNYDLTLGKAFSAVNLVTGEQWNIDQSSTPPDSIYTLPPEDAALQQALVAARRAHASALLSAPQGDAACSAALQAAQTNARRIDFSPPVVRRLQVEGRRGGQVFSLCMDGRVIAVDTALEDPASLACAVPLRPELVVAEIPRAQGDTECRLYYLTANGGISALDATGDLAVLTGWAGRGAPVAEAVLPLRYVDGLLMGGGILGNAFFARDLNPAKAPVFQMEGPPGGWREYDVAPAEKLVLVSDRSQSRLACYRADALTRDRWQLRSGGSNARSLFWPGTGSDATAPGPKLVIEAEVMSANAAAPAALRVVLANTVDAQVRGFPSDYPPACATLETATLGLGTWSTQPISSLPCRPVLAQQTLFCLYSSVRASGTADAVAAFGMAGLLGAVQPEATKKLNELKRMVARVRLRVTWRNTKHFVISNQYEYDGPHPYGNQSVRFVPSQGAPFELRTDGDGMVVIDADYAGRHVTIDTGNVRLPGMPSLSCNGTTLAPQAINSLQIEGYTQRRL